MAQGSFSKEELNTIIASYKGKLKSMKIRVSNVYLYGSYAKGTARTESDIDLCVISPQFNDRIEATMMLLKIRGDDELLISPIAFSPESFVDENPLAWEIKHTGISYN